MYTQNMIKGLSLEGRTTCMDIKLLNLFSKEFRQNPYDYYDKIRPHQPFAKVKMFSEGQHHTWMAFTYAAAVAVLTDQRFIKDARTVFPDEVTDESLPPVRQSMLFVDPPDHRRLRNLVQSGFTPKRIAMLRGRIEEIAREQALLMRNKGTVDIIEEYAFPIPIIVICELLGIPSEDRFDFHRWSQVLVQIDNPRYEEATMEFKAYLEKEVEKKRLSPKEDLLSDLIKAEEGGERLNISELYGAVMLLIVAGHETTVNLIANSLLALLTHQDQLALLKEDQSLVALAIEEVLRFNGPVEFSTHRWAKESFTFMGQQVEKGDHVIVSLASADRDPAVFADPNIFDITREKESPHLAFGKGIHHCLGAPLARLQGEIAIRILLEEYPDLSLAVELNELEWRPSHIVRGLKQLPIKLF